MSLRAAIHKLFNQLRGMKNSPWPKTSGTAPNALEPLADASLDVPTAATASHAADSYSKFFNKIIEVTYLDHFELGPEDERATRWSLRTIGKVVAESTHYIYLINEWSGGDGVLKPNLVAVLKNAITEIKVLG